jgi:hypothetical protein
LQPFKLETGWRIVVAEIAALGEDCSRARRKVLRLYNTLTGADGTV